MNDAICLVLAPLVLEMTFAMGRKPLPYLLAVAMASNVGSTATITGNPQNIMIGSFSHIPYTRFALTLGPVALAGLVVTASLIAICHRAEFAERMRPVAVQPTPQANRALVIRALAATGIMIALFFAGVAPAKAAIVIGGLLLLTRRVKSRRVYQEIDWSLLLMFAGLFIIVAGAERTFLAPASLARLPSRQGAGARRGDGGALEPREQRPGRADAETGGRVIAEAGHGLARHGHGLDLGGEFHGAGLDRQPHRHAARRPIGRDDRLLGLFPRRRPAYAPHLGDRDALWLWL